MDADNNVAIIAYELWLKNGCVHGKDCEHWLEAEKVVRQEQAVKKVTKPKASPKKPTATPKKPRAKKKTP